MKQLILTEYPTSMFVESMSLKLNFEKQYIPIFLITCTVQNTATGPGGMTVVLTEQP
jgi:hypothetical protein